VGIVRLNWLATSMMLSMATSSITFSMAASSIRRSDFRLRMRFCLSDDEGHHANADRGSRSVERTEISVGPRFMGSSQTRTMYPSTWGQWT